MVSSHCIELFKWEGTGGYKLLISSLWMNATDKFISCRVFYTEHI